MNPFMYVTPQLLFYAICLGLIASLLYLLSCLWPPDSPWSPWWKTDTMEGEHAIKLAAITQKDIVYELGCGDGEFICHVAKEYAKRAVGVEIDIPRYLISRFRKWKNHVQNLTVMRKNFFAVNLADATVVYVYLVPAALDRLLPKLKKELKPGTRIVSYRFEFSKIKPVKKIKGNRYPFFLYKI